MYVYSGLGGCRIPDMVKFFCRYFCLFEFASLPQNRAEVATEAEEVHRIRSGTTMSGQETNIGVSTCPPSDQHHSNSTGNNYDTKKMNNSDSIKRQKRNENAWDDKRSNTLIYCGGIVAKIKKDDNGCDDGKYRIEHSRTSDWATIIDHMAFACCKELIDIDISNQVKIIGASAFDECSRLRSVTFNNSNASNPSKLNTIGKYAFYQCNKLENMNIPNSIQSIGAYAFSGCFLLILNLDLSQSCMQIIKEYTFSSCRKMANIILPPFLKRIEKNAFDGCKSLSEISAPDRLEFIGDNAFSGCGRLLGIRILAADDALDQGHDQPRNKSTNDINRSMMNRFPTSIRYIGFEAVEKCFRFNSVGFPDTIHRIEEAAFSACRSLQEITLPDSMRQLPDSSFSFCRSLERVEFMPTATPLLHTIEYDAFIGCSSLRKIHLPDSVKVIEDNAFSNCSSLEEVGLPLLVEHIGEDVFRECSLLSRIGSFCGDYTNSIHYSCDLARGGRQFLFREEQGDGNFRRRHYHGGLWPRIVYRVLEKIKLPFHIIHQNKDGHMNKPDTYTRANPLLRRAGIVFFLMVNGIVMDLR